MAKRIVYTRPDGGVSVVVPVRPQAQGETEAEYLADIQARSVPAGSVNVRVVEHTDLPASRRFRNAWRDSGAAVAVGMAPARLIRRRELLARRDELLDDLRRRHEAASDDGQNARLVQIRNRRQALRALDTTLDLSGLTTPEALDAFTGPAALTDPLP